MDLDINNNKEPQLLHEIVCIETASGTTNGIRVWGENCNTKESFEGENGVVIDSADIINWKAGTCNSNIQCWKDKFIEGGLDNTFTGKTHTNQNYLATFNNGDVDTFAIASAASWTDQINQMGTGLSSIMPWAVTVESFCNIAGGCNGLPEPAVPLNKMIAKYVGFRVCPSAKVPVSIQYTSDQQAEAIELVVQYAETEVIYLDRCVTCGDSDSEYTLVETGEAYTPVCAVPCSHVYPDLPTTSCSFEYVAGCDDMGTTDASDDIQIFAVLTDCGDGPKVSYVIEDPAEDALINYTLVGEFRPDCVSDAVLTPSVEIDEISKNEICADGKTVWQVESVLASGSIVTTFEDETGVIDEPAVWTVGACISKYVTNKTPICKTDAVTGDRLPKFLVEYSDGTSEEVDPNSDIDNWCECDC